MARTSRNTDHRTFSGENPNDSEQNDRDFFEGGIPFEDAATIDMTAGAQDSPTGSCHDILEFDRLLDRYVLSQVIGRGGVGVIQRGWDTRLNREVAVKVLRKKYVTKPEMLSRFVNETRITSRLQHPGIVPVYESGIAPDNRPFFLMRLITGETMDVILKRRKDLHDGLSAHLSVFHRVCQTIAYAHSQGVIHRDIKPSNVMVGDFGDVIVMDWGLAKALRNRNAKNPIGTQADRPVAASHHQSVIPDSATESDTTLQGTVFGTPAYLPPEQALGENARIDERADVFGLGGILCCILTGHPPYRGKNCNEIFRKAISADLGDAHTRLDHCPVPAALLDLAKRCLAPDIDQRPASAADVVEALDAHFHADQRRAERDLVRFFELSLDLFCIAGLNGQFLRVNANFSRVLGYSAEELTSRPFFDFVHPDDLDATHKVLSRISFGEPCIRFINRYRHQCGQYLWFEWNARLVDEERAVYAVARDVTSRFAEPESRRKPTGIIR